MMLCGWGTGGEIGESRPERLVSQGPRRTGSGARLSQLSPEGMPGGVKEQADGTMS